MSKEIFYFSWTEFFFEPTMVEVIILLSVKVRDRSVVVSDRFLIEFFNLPLSISIPPLFHIHT